MAPCPEYTNPSQKALMPPLIACAAVFATANTAFALGMPTANKTTRSIGSGTYNNSSAKAPLNQKKRAFDIFTLLNDVYKKLHGWHAVNSHYGTLTRRNFQKTNREDGLKEYRLNYTVQLTDIKAQKSVIFTPVKEYFIKYTTITENPQKSGFIIKQELTSFSVNPFIIRQWFCPNYVAFTYPYTVNYRCIIMF
jgi:hypothetical protein